MTPQEVLETAGFAGVQEAEDTPLVLPESSAGDGSKQASDYGVQRPTGFQ